MSRSSRRYSVYHILGGVCYKGDQKRIQNQKKAIDFIKSMLQSIQASSDVCQGQVTSNYIYSKSKHLFNSNAYGTIVIDKVKKALQAFIVGEVIDAALPQNKTVRLMKIHVTCGSGWGDTLMKFIMKQAIKTQCQKMVLHAVWDTKKASVVPYYERYGFHTFEELRFRERNPCVGYLVGDRKKVDGPWLPTWWTKGRSRRSHRIVPSTATRCKIHPKDFRSRKDSAEHTKEYLKVLKKHYNSAKYARFFIRHPERAGTNVFMWRTTPNRV